MLNNSDLILAQCSIIICSNLTMFWHRHSTIILIFCLLFLEWLLKQHLFMRSTDDNAEKKDVDKGK